MTCCTRLEIDVWTARAQNHASLVGSFADAFIKRRAAGLSHPVHDFLFTYYNCSPLKLKQWVPAYDEELSITPEMRLAYPWLNDYWFHLENGILSSNRERLSKNSFRRAEFVRSLCTNILERAPRFRCFGLHEWAMVYKSSQEAIKHEKYPLRLPPEELASFVESQAICCSHYDAYRFFTPEAKPLNTLNPQLETRLAMEQGGCLHANMDLYKWAIKFWPWIGSDFIAKAFLLALEIRELDMRASPYDLRPIGYAPLCIETEEGRNAYQQEQQLFALRALPLREELRLFCDRFLNSVCSRYPVNEVIDD